MFETCGVTDDGSALCWGQNSRGQLGDGTTDDRVMPVYVASQVQFKSVSSWGNVSDGVNDNAHTCAVSTTNHVYCWGNGASGQLGTSTTETCPMTSCSTVPLPVDPPASGPGSFDSVAVAHLHSCAVGVDGRVYCWGGNPAGQLGDSTTSSRTTPDTVVGAFANPFVAVHVGGSSACGLLSDGDMYCWGLNLFGELGDGTTDSRLSPVVVSGGLKFASFDVGDYLARGVEVGSEDVFCWGRGSAGQLGTVATEGCDYAGSIVDCSTSPVRVSGGLSFESVSVGTWHACGVSAGAIYCWGWNTFGRFGDGGPGIVSTTPMPTTDPAEGPVTWSLVSAGRDHTCGVTTNGIGYCWGRNQVGQLGDGNTVDSSIPVRVSTPSN